jgi:hypothetical protein
MGKTAESLHDKPNPFNPYSTLIHLLPMVIVRRASNSRDKISSLWSLAQEGRDRGIEPDYTEAVGRVY